MSEPHRTRPEGNPPPAPPDAVTLPPSAPSRPDDLTLAPRVLPPSDRTSALTEEGRSAEGEGPPGDRAGVPGYELLAELGRGGMGVVYKARHLELGRVVALKMILSGDHAGPEALRRFRTEAQAVARLQHPNIVQVHEVGTCGGRPFFSLEFCPGGGLDRQLDGTPWQPHRAARLVETLARAMHHAHSQGVVHRDLKPANVLLAADGAPKVADFGLARKLDDESGQTNTGSVMGTPSYMAPEQAGGRSRDTGPPADTYALGAILYELLTGRPPFRAASALDTVLQVVNDEPVPVRRLQPKTPTDLETVCLTCLHKDPRRRYASAEALADDLGRFRAGEPVAARAVGRAERGWRWCRRNPAVAALLATVMLALALGAGVSGFFAVRAGRSAAEAEARADAEMTARRTAEDERRLAREQEQRALDARAEAEEQRGEALRRKAEAETERSHATTELHRARNALLTSQLMRVAAVCDRDPGEGLRLLDDPLACPPEVREITWGLYRRWCGDRATLNHPRPVTALAYHPGGKWLAAAVENGTVQVWDADTGAERVTLRGPPGPYQSAAWSHDGKVLAVNAVDGTVQLWDADTWKERGTLHGGKGVSATVCFSPDDKTLACSGGDGVKLLDPTAMEEKATLSAPPGGVGALAWGADNTLAGAGTDGTVRLWDATTGRDRAFKAHAGIVRRLAFSPDGKVLASGGSEGAVKLWDLSTGQTRATLPLRSSGVAAVCFSPDGKTVAGAAATPGSFTFLWDVASGQERCVLRRHAACLSFSPDGRTLASGSGGTVRLTDAVRGLERSLLRGHTGPVLALRFGPDGLLFSGGDDTTVRAWDARTGLERSAPLRGHRTPVRCLAFGPDGKTLVSAAGNVAEPGEVRVWDAATGEVRGTRGDHASGVWAVAVSPDNKTLATGTAAVRGPGGFAAGAARLWEADTGRERAALHGITGEVECVVFSPDGKTLATAGGSFLLSGQPARPTTDVAWGREAELKLFDAATGAERATLKGHQGKVHVAVFSPDGKTLASGGLDGKVRLWDTTTGKELRSLVASGPVWALAFSPDGGVLASGHDNGTIRMWDAVTAQERAAFPGRGGAVRALAFSPDGRTLASGGDDGVIRLW